MNKLSTFQCSPSYQEYPAPTALPPAPFRPKHSLELPFIGNPCCLPFTEAQTGHCWVHFSHRLQQSVAQPSFCSVAYIAWTSSMPLDSPTTLYSPYKHVHHTPHHLLFYPKLVSFIMPPSTSSCAGTVVLYQNLFWQK